MTSQSPAHLATTPALAWLLGFLGVVIFGATLPATHLALPHYGPIFIATARATIAGVLALTVLLACGKRQLLHNAGPLLIAGMMVTFGFPTFSSIAMQTVPASDGGVVLGILPLSTAVFAVLVARERPPVTFWLWAIIGSVLVLWFVLGNPLRTSADAPLHGYLWLVASALAASLGYVIMAQFSARMPGWEAICRVLVLCLPFNAVASVALWQPRYWALETVASSALVYHATFSMFLGFFFWNAALAMGGISRIGQIQLLQVFVTVAISAWILDETITARTLVFACAVATTVWFGRRAR
jgi:drug/metabolite transporter (DMT)-like permease